MLYLLKYRISCFVYLKISLLRDGLEAMEALEQFLVLNRDDRDYQYYLLIGNHSHK